MKPAVQKTHDDSLLLRFLSPSVNSHPMRLDLPHAIMRCAVFMTWMSLCVTLIIGAGGLAWGQDQQDDILDTSRRMIELENEERYNEALPLAEQVLQQSIETLGPNHSTVAIYMDHLGTLYGKMGRVAKAELFLRKALGIREKAFGPNHISIASSLSHLATIHALSGHYAMAQHLLRQGLVIRKSHLGPNHGLVAVTLSHLAGIYEQEGNYSESETLYREALTMQMLLQGPERSKMAETLNALSNLLRKTGRAAEATHLDDQAMTLLNQRP